MFIDSYIWNSVVISDIENVSKDVVAIRLEKPVSYQYHPGQYTVLKANDTIRQYSFSSAPSDKYIELLIQKEPNGDLSGWFHDKAAKGMTVEISQAFGSFTPPQPIRSFLCIAGRVGVAPFISMIRSQIHLELLYAVHDRADVCYPALLKQMPSEILYSNEGNRIDIASLKEHLTNEQLVYICGSKRFVDAIMNNLLSLGIKPQNIRRELFTLE